MADIDAEPPRSPSAEESPTDLGRPLLNWPVAVAAILLGLVVILGGGALVMRQVTGAANPEVTSSSTPIVSAAPTTAQVPTAQPPTLVPTTIAPAATSATTREATAVATAATLSTSSARAETPAPASGVGAGAEVGPTSASKNEGPQANVATVTPELVREVGDAYSRYWDVSAQALWNLDPAPLEQVATGEELAALRQSIQDDRAKGRALKTEVQHQYAVDRVEGDDAWVSDHAQDRSVYVDFETRQPLPQQDQSERSYNVVYHLRKVDGTWKANDATFYANS